MFFGRGGFFVCMSVRPSDYLKGSELICMKPLPGDVSPAKNRSILD